MGRRRIRDLTALGVEVESWDKTDEVPAPDSLGFDAIIISTPPKTKWLLAQSPAARGQKVFCEADVEWIGPTHFPSATPLFTEWYRRVRMECYPPVAAYTLHVGQHIDDWHPGADPKTYYAYRDETGPTREMIPFELIWLTKLFGPVIAQRGVRNQKVATLSLEHDNLGRSTLGHILIDTLSRPAVRTFRVVADGFQKSWDLTYDEETYLWEMRALIAAVEGRTPWPYSQAEEAANLEVLHTIERSG